MLKENSQPRLHWSTEHRFHRLWVLGIKLPGVFRSNNVDTLEKVMEIVDPLMPEILRILHTKLSKGIKECIERVRTLKADKGQDSTVAVQKIATTTPPRCLVDTLIICRDEISHRQQSIEIAKQLDATLSSSHPEGRELARFQAQRLTSSPTYPGKLQAGIEDKLKKWRPRSYTIKLLPPLTRRM